MTADSADAGLAAEMAAIGARARTAAAALALASAATKTAALRAAAQAVRARSEAIVAANARDRAEAREAGLTPALEERLALDGKRVEAIAAGLDAIAALPDPVGRSLARWTRPNGLDIERVAVPLPNGLTLPIVRMGKTMI